MIASKNKKFLEILVAKGLLSEKDVLQLNKVYKEDAFAILKHLCQGFSGGAINKSELGKIWGDSIGASYIELEKTIFQAEVIQQLPQKFSKENQVIPIYQFGDTVTLATATPGDTDVLSKVESIIQKKVSPVFALPEEIENAIAIHYKSTEG